MLFFLSNRTLLSLCVMQGAESEFELHVHCQSLVKKHVYSSGPKTSRPYAGTVQGPSYPVQFRALFTFLPSLLNPKLLHRGALSESAAMSSQMDLQLREQNSTIQIQVSCAMSDCSTSNGHEGHLYFISHFNAEIRKRQRSKSGF